ncbi:phospho-2-dehydro-3-deoxyheptonate aldolase [Clostridium sp. CAG:411]|jgi:3-deoxy-7-phosphoheptulonate synthase|nr:phospho-2-dehydro-3-deoxyheptonate aldolase [Clostridium sp. CAG:411]
MDMQMNIKRKLYSPNELKEKFPMTERMKAVKEQRDQIIADILSGKSDKMMLIIGPCSADREDAVLEYISRLKKVQEIVEEKLILVPRIYTNKPRTTGEGYKGIALQPDPEEDPDMLKGLLSLRELHIRAVQETELTCADEMLYPENHSYLSDVLSYVAVGARSVENQQHRLTASGVGIPVGMKNPTSGDLEVMLNSILAAQIPHTISYRGYEVETPGNPFAHAILRGYVKEDGKCYSNYHYEDLEHLYEAYQKRDLENQGVIVDTNHANSNKNYLAQIRICKEVLHSCHLSKDIRSFVKGFMIESYLKDGNQKIGEGCYGKSITDPCLGWEKTERLILDIAELL